MLCRTRAIYNGTDKLIALLLITAGFSGELCNYEYNECESNPCLNNGQCNDHIGGFTCKCTPGYTGKRCQIKVRRKHFECFVKGRNTSTNFNAKQIDFCVSNPCPEGRQCNDHGNDYSCDCPEGRAEPDCTQYPRMVSSDLV